MMGSLGQKLTFLSPKFFHLQHPLLQPSNFYISTLEGFYRSADQGESWEQANQGITGIEVLKIKNDPNDPSVIYVGTRDYGMFKSVDYGETWNPLDEGVGQQYIDISDLAFHPSIANTLYFAANGSGVYESNDGGLNWNSINGNLPTTLLDTISIDPSAPSTLYVSGYRTLFELVGVYKSTNGGGTWMQMGQNTFLNGAEIAIDPFDSNHLIVTQNFGRGAGGELKYSNDGGQSWHPGNGFPCHIIPSYPSNYSYCSQPFDIEYDPLKSGVAYVALYDEFAESGTETGIYQSTNGGETWVNLHSANGVPRTVRVSPGNSSHLYLGYTGLSERGSSNPGFFLTPGGFLLSVDGGLQWQQQNTGLQGVSVYAISFAPNNPDKIYLGTSGGVYSQTFWYGTYLPITERGKP